ncbi:MAG: hypothetical protein LBF26_01235 [Puniceicoccales bacterium]|jgi:hypothetical protein|nr:hypothetical protein [Puniceicoccales bacterium]
MTIRIGKSHFSWTLSPGQDGQNVHVTLKSVRDAFRLGGFGQAFSYAFNCLVTWNLSQEVTPTETEAANFIAGNLNKIDDEQVDQLCQKPEGQDMPVIALVVKAGNADAKKNVLQFFQNDAHNELLKQKVDTSHNGMTQMMTLAKLICDVLPKNEGINDDSLNQFNIYCSQKKIPLTVERTDAGARVIAPGTAPEPLIRQEAYADPNRTYVPRTGAPKISQNHTSPPSETDILSPTATGVPPNATDTPLPATKLSVQQEIEQFLIQNDLGKDTNEHIRRLPEELQRLASFLKEEHTRCEIELEIKSIFKSDVQNRRFLHAVRDLFLTGGMRELLIEVLKGRNGKSLADLMPLGSDVGKNFIEPLCQMLEISYTDVNDEFGMIRQEAPLADEYLRFRCEVERLLNLNTPESIYAAINLFGRYFHILNLHIAQRNYGDCRDLEKFLGERIMPSLKLIQPHMAEKALQDILSYVKKWHVEIKKLSERVYIPNMPAEICPNANSAEFSPYMQAVMDYIESQIQWCNPKGAYEAFKNLRLTETILLHLQDAYVERLEALLAMKSPDGISMEGIARNISSSARVRSDKFDANKKLIAERLAWTEEKLSKAWAEITPENAHEKLFQRGRDGPILMDAIIKRVTPEHREKLLQILAEVNGSKFVEILNHGQDGANLVNFLASDAAGGKVLYEKLAAIDGEQFLDALNDSVNGKKIFAFLCRTEEGCALLERQFTNPEAFIRLIGKPWFGPDELHFFMLTRGVQEVYDRDDSGEDITIREWISGISDPGFFLQMAYEPGVLYAAMQRKDLWPLFVQSIASRTGMKPENILDTRTFIDLMRSQKGGQIFENMRAAAAGDRTPRKTTHNLFVGLLKDPTVVRELSQIPWIGEKLINAVKEFELPSIDNDIILLRRVCADALLNSGWTDNAVWEKILETPENRAVLWAVCNEFAQTRGPQAQVYFSRLTQSEPFRRLTIGHECGHCHAESAGNPEVLIEIGRALTSQAKCALLLGRMTSETTYGESCTQYRLTGVEIPELISDAPAGKRHANLAQEMLHRHSDQLLNFMDGMDDADVAGVLQKRADNGCTLLEFSVLNRRDSAVTQLTDYYRKKRVPFSRVELREMLAFKERAFRDVVENLVHNGNSRVGLSVGGIQNVALGELGQWERIAKEFSPSIRPKDWWEQRSAAVDELMKRDQEAFKTDPKKFSVMVAICEIMIADGKKHSKNVLPIQDALYKFLDRFGGGVSGRIRLAVGAVNGDAGAEAAYEQHMTALIGESPSVAGPTGDVLDERILHATKIEFTGRDAAGWTAVVDGAAMRIENVTELTQCQKLETITFDLFVNKLTADELFALRNVKALKKLEAGRFSDSLTPNIVEILFRARPDLHISATCSDGQKLTWDPEIGPNIDGFYSCCPAKSTRIGGKKRVQPIPTAEAEAIERRRMVAMERDMAAREAALAREASRAAPVPPIDEHPQTPMEKITKERLNIPGADL